MQTRVFQHFFCWLFTGHSFVFRYIRDRQTRHIIGVYGECTRCGHESNGWELVK